MVARVKKLVENGHRVALKRGWPDTPLAHLPTQHIIALQVSTILRREPYRHLPEDPGG